MCLALPSIDHEAANVAGPFAELTVSDLPAVSSASQAPAMAEAQKSGTPLQARLASLPAAVVTSVLLSPSLEDQSASSASSATRPTSAAASQRMQLVLSGTHLPAEKQQASWQAPMASKAAHSLSLPDVEVLSSGTASQPSVP